jgi:hypothetical protein
MAHYHRIACDCYRLMAPGHHKNFPDFFSLCCYCRARRLTLITY